MRDGGQPLSPELAEKILRYSDNNSLDSFVAPLSRSGKADYPTYAKLMSQAGIPPMGSAPPLRVALHDVLKFMASNPEFPEPMKTALTPRQQDSPLTYFATEVAHQFVAAAQANVLELDQADTPMHFKIGLIDTSQEESVGQALPHVTWWLRQGSVDMVGYGIGGAYIARLAMLHAVGCAERYALRKYF